MDRDWHHLAQSAQAATGRDWDPWVCYNRQAPTSSDEPHRPSTRFDVPRTTLAQGPSSFDIPRTRLAQEPSSCPVSLVQDMIIELQELRADVVELRSTFLLLLRCFQNLLHDRENPGSPEVVGPWDFVSQVMRSSAP